MVKFCDYGSRRRHRAARRLLCVGTATFFVLVASGCGLLDDFEQQVAADIKDNPVILRHIGDITSIDTDWTATGEQPGDDVFVFRLTGTKGEASLTAECITVDAEHEDVISGSIRLPSGETIDLYAR